MKYFNPIEREFIAPINLEIANKSLETMEKGHLEAVKTASALKTAISQLDMNEAEDEFKYGLINEIQKTINDNTIYGNSFAALDDLVAKQGDLLSRPDVKGRLDAQKDYKTWLAELDKSGLNELYKNYYKEVNPYEYQDKYNDKGELIGGSKWAAKEKWVNEIPFASLGAGGVQLAAVEEGGSNTSTDEYSGGSSYRRKTENKIKKGILAYINATPGAWESLSQDYKIAKYYYYKNKNSNPEYTNRPLISEFTDSQGNILSPSDFLDKRMSYFIDAGKFYNVNTVSDYRTINRNNPGGGNNGGSRNSGPYLNNDDVDYNYYEHLPGVSSQADPLKITTSFNLSDVVLCNDKLFIDIDTDFKNIFNENTTNTTFKLNNTQIKID